MFSFSLDYFNLKEEGKKKKNTRKLAQLVDLVIIT